MLLHKTLEHYFVFRDGKLGSSDRFSSLWILSAWSLMGTFDRFLSRWSTTWFFIANSHLAEQIADYKITRSESGEKRRKEFCLLCQNRPTTSCLIHNNVRREILFIHIDEWLEACVWRRIKPHFSCFFCCFLHRRPKRLARKAYRFRSLRFELRPETFYYCNLLLFLDHAHAFSVH